MKHKHARKILDTVLLNGQRLESYLNNRPYLKFIDSDVYDISGRIYEYDPTFFILYNHAREQFEIHNIENKGNTYCFSAKELDSRVLKEVWITDTKKHGVHTLFDEMELQEKRAEEAQARERKNIAEGLARETAGHWKAAFKDI